MKAIITGSFDPVTLGHEDIIKRAAALFEEVTVAVCINSSKTGCFTPEQRLTMLALALSDLKGVKIVLADGLCADYCHKNGIGVIVRGLRGAVDYEYEASLSRINAALEPNVETVFLPCNPSFSHISSNVVREMLRYNRSPAPFVSKKVCEFIEKTFVIG